MPYWIDGGSELVRLQRAAMRRYQIADRSGKSAVKLLGEDYGGTLVTDDAIG
jgi:hypothetical protein